MLKKEWDSPIDSRLIYNLLKDITGHEKSRLYRMLWLDNNEGLCCAGTRVKTCWWPEHENYFFIASRDLELSDSVLYAREQKFPIPKADWKNIASKLNEKENERESKDSGKNNKHKKMLPNTVYYYEADIEYQVTFASHVFDVLVEQLNLKYKKEDEKKSAILDVCKKYGIPQDDITRIGMMDKSEEILTYIILRAKSAKGSPLVVRRGENPTKASAGSEKTWRILSASELVSELNMSPMDISARILENDRALYDQLPAECAGTQHQWANIFTAFGEHCRFLLDSNDIQGNYSIYGLSPEQ